MTGLDLIVLVHVKRFCDSAHSISTLKDFGFEIDCLEGLFDAFVALVLMRLDLRSWEAGLVVCWLIMLCAIFLNRAISGFHSCY